jgi:uncharacterized protein YuzE
MGEEIVTTQLLKQMANLTPHLMQLPHARIWIDCDKEADVLYVSFKRPQKATDSRMTKNGCLLRYKEKELVGITILDASKPRKRSRRNGRAK